MQVYLYIATIQSAFLGRKSHFIKKCVNKYILLLSHLYPTKNQRMHIRVFLNFIALYLYPGIWKERKLLSNITVPFFVLIIKSDVSTIWLLTFKILHFCKVDSPGISALKLCYSPITWSQVSPGWLFGPGHVEVVFGVCGGGFLGVWRWFLGMWRWYSWDIFVDKCLDVWVDKWVTGCANSWQHRMLRQGNKT